MHRMHCALCTVHCALCIRIGRSVRMHRASAQIQGVAAWVTEGCRLPAWAAWMHRPAACSHAGSLRMLSPRALPAHLHVLRHALHVHALHVHALHATRIGRQHCMYVHEGGRGRAHCPAQGGGRPRDRRRLRARPPPAPAAPAAPACIPRAHTTRRTARRTARRTTRRTARRTTRRTWLHPTP